MLEPLASHRGTTPGVSKSEVAGLLKATQSFDGQLVTELPMNVTLTVRRKRARENSFIQMPPLEGGQEGMRGNFNGHAGGPLAGAARWPFGSSGLSLRHRCSHTTSSVRGLHLRMASRGPHLKIKG